MVQSGVLAPGELEKLNSEPSGKTLTAVAQRDAERNPIFDALVSEDGEISGLVAYSIYKQNKRSWLEDFKKLVGRLPTEAETRAYIIGESTERRLATYRLLAQTTLGHNPLGAGAGQRRGGGGGAAAAIWALAIVVALGLVGFGLHAFNFVGPK